MLDYDTRWNEGTPDYEYQDFDEPEHEDEDDYESRCVACGNPMSYCQGHGEIGDPAGNAILEQHDAGDHSECHPDGCDEAPAPEDRD